MKPAEVLALAILPLLLLEGSELSGSRHGSADTPLVVSPAWLEAHLDDPGLVLLEIGSLENFKAGHVRLARPANVMAFHNHGTAFPDPSHFVPTIEALGISNSSTIVLYGDKMDRALLWIVFEYLGLGDQTMVLDGGKEAWVQAGKRLTRESGPFSRGRFTPRPRPEIVVDAPWVSSRLRDPTLALIDARSPAEYAGAPTADHGPGHIPGAGHLDWEETVDSAGRLLPRAELKARFARAGYATGDDLVVYCTVGMRASHLYFVARSLGYSPRIYLGSIQDWTSDPSRPIERAASE